jgi:hypothetical protein
MASKGDQTTASPDSGGVMDVTKICLANYYKFVIMRGIYENNVLFLRGLAELANPADRMRMFDILCR